jgi:hypothetical protein
MPDGTFALVFGRHRLEAAKLNSAEEIRGHVVSPDDVDKLRLAEIDENLIRAELSDAERAAHMTAREKIFTAAKLKAEGVASKKELAGKKSAEAKKGKGKEDSTPPKLSGVSKRSEFEEETAKELGRSATSVARDVSRGAALEGVDGTDAADLAGTSLDKGVELDAAVELKKLNPQALVDVVKAAKAGDKTASARKELAKVKPAAKSTLSKGAVESASKATNVITSNDRV